MRNTGTKFIVTTAFALLLIPQVSFAAWWNPLSWFKSSQKADVSVRKESILATTTNRVLTSTSSEKIGTAVSSAQQVKQVAKPAVMPIVSKYPLFVASIHAFLARPNLTSLTEVCNQAKSVPTGSTKEVLSEDRLTMQKVPLTFFDDFKNICGLIGQKDLKAVDATPNAFVISLSPDDSDAVRIAKIQSNANMTSKNKYAQFYIYTTTDNLSKLFNGSDMSMRCPTKEEMDPKVPEGASISERPSFGTTNFVVRAPTLFILSLLNDMTRPKTIGIELNEKEKQLQKDIEKMDLGYGYDFSLGSICFKTSIRR